MTSNNNSEIKSCLLPFKSVFKSAALFSAVINILMLIPSIYMLEVYDKVLTSRNETTLYMLSLIMLALYVLYGYLESIRTHTISSVGDSLELKLNERVFESSFQDNLNTLGQGSTQYLNDLSTIRQFVSSPALSAFFDFPWFPIYLAVIFLFNFWLGIYSIISIIIVISLAFLNEIKTKESIKSANIELIKSNMLASSTLKNSEVIASMGMLDSLKSRWLEVHKKFLEMQRISQLETTNISCITKTVRITLQSLALGIAALLVLNNQLLPGMMIASTILLGKALSPIEQIISGWKQYKNAKLAYGRLGELLNNNPSKKDTIDLPAPVGFISVDKLVSGFPNSSNAILKGISFTLNKGDVLAVVGPSGAGKSNLARQLLGIWPTISGFVRLDGVDMHTWDKNKLGKFLGYVPQDIELFPGTIAENIARFGEVNSELVVLAAKKAGIHDMILKLPENYNTKLGFSGDGLSGGQKQRLALARAIYGNPVFIVMDEPNSNLDTAGEIALMEAIKSFKEIGSTIVIVSHRQPVLQVSNKMMVLNEGSVLAFGETSEVLSKLTTNTSLQSK